MTFAKRLGAQALCLGVVIASCGSDGSLADRQEAVADAGADVMPFDLGETTHIFTDTSTGGRQDVVADNPADVSAIELIRDHLADEADKFRRGDFSDPEAIHGATMPGLQTLKSRYGEIDVNFLETAEGAAIIYAAENPDLVAAVHQWFEAQTSDHGSHAEHNG